MYRFFAPSSRQNVTACQRIFGTKKTMIIGIAVGLLMMTGCAETTMQSGAQHWERRVLANGVELHVSNDANVDARRIAEDVQSEMRSRYIGAR